jgi:thiol-disulfide isomerase/thioredoxin
MNDAWLKRLLWLLIPAILILIAAVAVVERVTRPAVAVIPIPVTSIPVENVRTGARIGLVAPDFTLPTTGDKEFKLSDYRGKNVVLNFWATWCGPCRYEVPSLKALHDKYGNDSTVLVAVSSLDNPDSVASYATANDLKFIIPLDPKGVVSTLYNIRGMPTTIFINDKGIITSIKIGPFISLEEIEERLTSSR